MSEMTLQKALRALNGHIEDGMEYPDAEWRVAYYFNLSNEQVEALRRAYSEGEDDDL